MSAPRTTAVPSPRAAAASHAPLRTWLRLLTCSSLVERAVRRRLRDEFDTTLPRFDVLAQLDAAARDSVQGLTMSELSRRLMVTNGNLTGLVERLAQEGLVTRAAAEGDRRMQMVRLSAAGRRALQTMTPAHEEWIDGMFQDLSADELDQLGQLLGKLRDSIRHAPAGADQP